ncbi:hypothetical protein C0Q70_01981 [Pomacea canaliculata]|uniref:Uncharacterized protein n=1 Tax=Pomacea canaliculata TaxID=400727 RepID=A0A2T7Q102_POMCA|nr:hypothetical protein C0Q70_01981 [Pomacea canaliculata]
MSRARCSGEKINFDRVAAPCCCRESPDLTLGYSGICVQSCHPSHSASFPADFHPLRSHPSRGHLTADRGRGVEWNRLGLVRDTVTLMWSLSCFSACQGKAARQRCYTAANILVMAGGSTVEVAGTA